MPWTMNDYPSSMKNLNNTTRKKAIDIANSMVDEGYDEDRAIPIATSQAKEWAQNANQSERDRFKNSGKPTERSEEGKKYDDNPERLEEGEHVITHNDGWAVRSSDAERPSHVFENKNDAIQRAQEIAENKGTYLIVHRQDGSIQEHQSY
ncbi:DUF2188 domain-containing protein [Lentibacillus salicampi]|uniref:DUF2188 domain-containing protein n=1 Tax=Lentibacillus salicampi TaxID=175306 RepID=A0A4Y9A805_9BACI|nr:DUF2188 domain-containing protein [Lentibacillus salicampi]TFJ91595.1 DUF2188 domain-containing protein [Lentibacillus salicampi]